MKFWTSSLSSLWSLLGYYGRNFGSPDCKACVFAGPATDKIFEVQIVRFVVFAGPATDEILELQFVKLTTDEILELQIVRLVVFAGPATDMEVQIVRSVVFAGPATDEILELQFVRFVVWARPARTSVWNSRL